MANARQKKKRSARATQATRKRTRRKDRRQMRSMAAGARRELRRGIPPIGEHAPESSRSADAQLTERSGERFTNTFGDVREGAPQATEQPVGNLVQVFLSGTIVASAMRSVLQELFSFTQERMHQNFARLLALTYCRTPPQLIAAQKDFIRDNVDGLVRSTGRIADVSMQMAHEGVRRMGTVSLARR
jgi:hypothetical protein